MLDYVLKRDKGEKMEFMSSTLIDFHFIIAKQWEERVSEQLSQVVWQ